MSKFLIHNISELIQVRNEAPELLKGSEMAHLPGIRNAWLLIEDDKIIDFGNNEDLIPQHDEKIDAGGGMVFPAWCDSHTHIVYAGSRETEFVDKINGLSYEEIAKRGGGILNSAARLQQTSEDDLFNQALQRCHEIMSYGTGAVEIKSGYGLTVQDEIKMLRVIKRLKNAVPLEIKSTFLGAHAIPAAFRDTRSKYIDLIVNEMIPQVAEEKLADYVDVFCDKGFFTVEETDRILAAGVAQGLTPKIHANELDYSGGIQIGVKHGALSVDHLEFTGKDEIETLLNSSTMPTLLPSTAFFLRLHYPPAREMISAGLPVALATDYNPGSSPSGRMSFVLSLACIYLRMTPEEAINAATINSAYAMGLSSSHGSISKGKTASFFITKPIPSAAFLPYSFGSDLIKDVFIAGKKIMC
ncbi:MAG: imidazolonepropionase [Bacteroidetes bacterium]|nr:imidazolonepropionase [Bacteroidota bacterium]